MRPPLLATAAPSRAARPWLAVALLAAPAIAQTKLPSMGSETFELSPRNVVVIVLDDVGHDLVRNYAERYSCAGCGAGGAPLPCTPNIDQLIAEGVRFSNAWASPWCSPTRAQILTGKRAYYTGLGRFLTFNPPGLDPSETTLADRIPNNGSIGKWHLASESQGYTHPLRMGFQTFAGTMRNLAPPPADGPDYYDWRRYDAISPPVQQSAYVTATTARDAIVRLQQLAGQPAPWFLHVNFHAVHAPPHCPPAIGATPCPTNWTLSCQSPCTFSEQTCRTLAMMQYMDAKIGQILSYVDATDTVVILVGDNGTPAFAKNAPFVHGHKGTMYQGGVNVPLVVRGGGLRAGVDVHALVHVTDIFATVGDLAGVTLPSGPAIDSVSFAPFLHPSYARSTPPRKYVYAEAFQPNFRPVNGRPPSTYVASHHNRALRNDKYKLIERNLAGGIVQEEFYLLYDDDPLAPPTPQDPSITPDPHEQVNLMLTMGSWSPEEQAAYAELVSELSTYPKLPVSP